MIEMTFNILKKQQKIIEKAALIWYIWINGLLKKLNKDTIVHYFKPLSLTLQKENTQRIACLELENGRPLDGCII